MEISASQRRAVDGIIRAMRTAFLAYANHQLERPPTSLSSFEWRVHPQLKRLLNAAFQYGPDGWPENTTIEKIRGIRVVSDEKAVWWELWHDGVKVCDDETIHSRSPEKRS
jgi:hypothetical protein